MKLRFQTLKHSTFKFLSNAFKLGKEYKKLSMLSLMYHNVEVHRNSVPYECLGLRCYQPLHPYSSPLYCVGPYSRAIIKSVYDVATFSDPQCMTQ